MSDQSFDSQPQKKLSGIEFLLSFACQGRSEQDDVSERDEEILASEVDPIPGWRVDDKDQKIDL